MTLYLQLLKHEKEYISQYKHKKEIFDLKEWHDINELDLETPNKNFFTNNFIMDVFVFIMAIIFGYNNNKYLDTHNANLAQF